MTQVGQYVYDVIVIGAGAAGIGVGVALKHAGIENFRILDRQRVGESFDRWPAETRFITPSFPTNSVGMLDLNSIAIGVSPGYSLEVEHPTGQEYASHLRGVSQFFELPVQEGVDVQSIDRAESLFQITTSSEALFAKHVIWAAGEFQYPRRHGFPGCEHCMHTATVPSFAELKGEEFIVIGGSESGVDAAFHLSSSDKSVRLFDSAQPWEDESSDPSVSLSPCTLERMREEWFEEQVELLPNTPIASVDQVDGAYEVRAVDGSVFRTSTRPLYAGGFSGSHLLIENMFELREDGFPLLTENDESSLVPGMFLCGPLVRHDHHIFCFIYKYRQRFAVVAKAIANSLGLPAEELEKYRRWGMYLDDLSCCGEECVC
ncbi:NAD(P)/FAD-dependent oxidoreductase [Rhodopirellula baltica]